MAEGFETAMFGDIISRNYVVCWVEFSINITSSPTTSQFNDQHGTLLYSKCAFGLNHLFVASKCWQNTKEIWARISGSDPDHGATERKEDIIAEVREE